MHPPILTAAAYRTCLLFFQAPASYEHVIGVRSEELATAVSGGVTPGMGGLLRSVFDQQQVWCDGCGQPNVRNLFGLLGHQQMSVDCMCRFSGRCRQRCEVASAKLMAQQCLDLVSCFLHQARHLTLDKGPKVLVLELGYANLAAEDIRWTLSHVEEELDITHIYHNVQV